MKNFQYLLSFFILGVSIVGCGNIDAAPPGKSEDNAIEMRYETEGMTFFLDRLNYIIKNEEIKKEYPFFEKLKDENLSPEEMEKVYREMYIRTHAQNGDPIFHPVEITVHVEPKEIQFGRRIKIRMFAKNTGEVDIEHFGDQSPSVAIWISSEQLKEVYPCLKIRKKSYRSTAPSTGIFFARGQKTLLYEEEFDIPDINDLSFPFWKSWRELPEDKKSECTINLRIKHPSNSNVYDFSHAITILPISENEIALREERHRDFLEKSNFQINTVWKGTIESIPSAYKEWIYKKDNSNQSSK